MAALATPAFLNTVKAAFPQKSPATYFSNPWYIVAAVAFSASNEPQAVPCVFHHVLDDIRSQGAALEDQRLLARKLRDAIFKSGLTSGYPRAINSLIALHEAMPEELRDAQMMRNNRTPIEEHERVGRELFNSIYGKTAEHVQGLLDTIYPDMGWFSNTIGYGLTYGYTGVLSPVETSYTLVAALIAGDTPRQIGWHLDGARRAGATYEEAQAVKWISMEVASHAGIKWREEVPEVKQSIDE